MPKIPTIAITGATGFIGSELVDYFHSKGWRVIALVRDINQKTMPKDVLLVHYDIAETPNKNILSSADYLVHAAYMEGSSDNIISANQVAADKLLQISKASGVKRNLFISSLSARKDSPSTYGKQKFEVEQLFSDSHDSILRLGLVVGRGGLVGKTIDFIKKWHVLPIIGRGDQPMQIVGIDDVPKVIEKILIQNLGGLYTLASTDVYSYIEFYRLLIKRLKIRAVPLHLPPTILITLISLANILHINIGITKENIVGAENVTYQNSARDLRALDIDVGSLQDILDRII